MKLKRLRLVSAVVALPILATGVVIFTHHDQPKTIQLSAATKAAPNTEQKANTVKDTTTTSKTPVETPTAAKTAVQSAVVPQPTAIQPDYGEDPTNPGIFIVFNKTSVMTQAGIPAAEQPAADVLITKMMNWRYKQTAFPESDLCYITPVSKMAIMGADYRDNPVTQLKYCQALVSARYGTWDATLAQYKGSGSF
jgi:hypothetical protein